MYKVIINSKKGLDKILVFNGNVNITNELLKNDPNNEIFKTIFNEIYIFFYIIYHDIFCS